MRPHRVALVISLVLAACAEPVAEPPPDPELVTVAEEVCTVMWNWQLDIGGIMNAMSLASRIETDVGARRSLYRDTFADARRRNQELAASIEALPSSFYVERLREDIRNGLFVADRIISEIDAEVDALHAAGNNEYPQVVSHIFVGFEKVIDVAKPELADYADAELTKAFMSVAQCQNGVKDANDGTPKFAPRS
ncbi:MAG: hypothetical protein WD020_03865 [Acidimicrobiia bacterium]